MKTVDITFCVQGYIKQTVELTNDNYTPEQVQDLLDKGEALTTIQEGGNVCLYDAEGNEIVLGKVVNVDNNLEYDDFDVEEGE